MLSCLIVMMIEAPFLVHFWEFGSPKPDYQITLDLESL